MSDLLSSAFVDGVERDGVFVPFATVTASTPAPKYRFLVEDIMSGRILGELPLVDDRFEVALNRPGGLTAGLPADHPKAEWLQEGLRAIYVERDGKILLGGPLWDVDRPMGERTLRITVGGWFGYFDHRQIWESATFTNTDQFAIFEGLVDAAQDEGTLGAGADLGISVTYDALSGVLRTRQEGYRDYDASNLGQRLRELAAVEDGFDFHMQYALDPGTDSVTKTVRLYYPQKGRDTGFLFQFEGGRQGSRPDWVTDGGEIVLDDGEPVYDGTHPQAASGLRSNITAWGVRRSVSNMAWRMRGWGDGYEADRLRSEQVTESMRGVYPMLDADVTEFSSVKLQATLDANTAGELARRDHPLVLPVIEVNPDIHPRFGDWAVGDTVRLRINDGFGSIAPRREDTPMSVRIIGYQMDSKRDRPTLMLEPV